MEPSFFSVLFAFAAFIPLIVVVHRMTRGRPTERYERRAWTVSLICAFAALVWSIFRILGLFSSGEATTAAAVFGTLTHTLTVVMLVTAVPGLVALALTVIATRRHRARLRVR